MSDFDLSDIEEMQVSLELEDGSTLECEVIYIFEWNGDETLDAISDAFDEMLDEEEFGEDDEEDDDDGRWDEFIDKKLD